MLGRKLNSDLEPREQLAYSPAEVAHYIAVPVSTVRYWCLGRDPYAPLIRSAQMRPLLLSFINLVELHVLGAIRRRHRVSMPNVRRALDYVEREMRVSQPLANHRFRTDGAHLFIDQYGQLINASQRGQTAMREILEAALIRIEWDDRDQPVRLFPYTRKDTAQTAKFIVIDPTVCGGRAVIDRTRIAVEVVAERFKAGDSFQDLVADYGCEPEAIQEAIRCELPIAA